MTKPRVPTDLQEIFLASNQGEEVHKPPPSKSAFRVFKSTFKAGIKRFKVRKETGKAPRSASFCTTASSVPSTVFTSDDDHHQEAQSNWLTVCSPQAWVQAVLPQRGYSTDRIHTVTTGYMTQPTALQLASCNTKTVALTTSDKLDTAVDSSLRKILSCGISLNACDINGETLMHKACRLGCHQVLQVFIDLGAELRVCDAQGRTLLHAACWGARPSFQTFRLLMLHAPELLFMEDCRGACPLEYVHKTHYDFWLDFLQDNKDRFWPVGKDPGLSDRARGKPNTLPIPTPVHALSCELAQLVASGRMEPDEVLLLTTSRDSGAASSHHESDSTVLSDEESEDEEDSWCELDEGLIEELDELLAKYGRARS